MPVCCNGSCRAACSSNQNRLRCLKTLSSSLILFVFLSLFCFPPVAQWETDDTAEYVSKLCSLVFFCSCILLFLHVQETHKYLFADFAWPASLLFAVVCSLSREVLLWQYFILVFSTLIELGLFSSEQKRMWGDLHVAYKMMRVFDRINMRDLFTPEGRLDLNN